MPQRKYRLTCAECCKHDRLYVVASVEAYVCLDCYNEHYAEA